MTACLLTLCIISTGQTHHFVWYGSYFFTPPRCSATGARSDSYFYRVFWNRFLLLKNNSYKNNSLKFNVYADIILDISCITLPAQVLLKFVIFSRNFEALRGSCFQVVTRTQFFFSHVPPHAPLEMTDIYRHGVIAVLSYIHRYVYRWLGDGRRSADVTARSRSDRPSISDAKKH